MPANTPIYGFPYPLGSDPVRDGDNDIRALAESVENELVDLNGDNYGPDKNLFRNGDLSVNQRGFVSGSLPAVGISYLADGWLQLINNTGSPTANVFVAYEPFVSSLPYPGNGNFPGYRAQNYLGVSLSGFVDALNGGFGIQQRIENARRGNGRRVTVSFWAGTNSGTAVLGGQWIKNYGGGGSPSATEILTPVGTPTITIDATWKRYSMSFNIPSDIGKTYGTNNNSQHTFLLVFCGTPLGSGSYNLPNQNGKSFYIWGLQAEINDEVTSFSQRTPQAELALCQRYYERAGQNGIFCKQNSTTLIGNVYFSVPKYRTPLCFYISGSGVNLDYPGINSVAVTGATFGVTSAVSVRTTVTISTNSANNTAYFINESQTPFIEVSAEV